MHFLHPKTFFIDTRKKPQKSSETILPQAAILTISFAFLNLRIEFLPLHGFYFHVCFQCALTSGLTPMSYYGLVESDRVN